MGIKEYTHREIQSSNAMPVVCAPSLTHLFPFMFLSLLSKALPQPSNLHSQNSRLSNPDVKNNNSAI